MVRRIAILVSSAAILAACGGTATSPPPATATPAPSRVAVVKLAGCVNCGLMNPFASNVQGNAQALMSLVYDSLAWKDSNNNVIPWMATKWSVSADGKTWRFTLRSGIKWQDGQPLTADDVAFTFNYVTSGAAGNIGTFGYRSIALKVKTATAESADVVVFTTDGPNPTFLDDIGVRVPIIPKHIWASVTDPVKYTGPGATMGSGPYAVTSYDSTAGSYQFTANDAWWGGPPRVQRIEFVPAPDPILALRRGDIDVAEPGSAPFTDETLKSFASSRYGLVVAGGTGGPVLQFNELKGFPYNSVEFRQAMAYAINRQEMVDHVLLGRGKVANLGLIEPAGESQWVPKDMPTYAYSKAKATALLDQAGLKVGAGGKRTLPSGQIFQPVLQVDGTLTAGVVAMVKNYLQDVGIDVQIQSLDRPSLQANGNTGNYQMNLLSYGIGSDPEVLRSYLWSKAPTTWWKALGWNNAQFDQLLQQQATQVDPVARKQTSFTMQRLVAQEVPALPLYMSDRIAIYDKTVLTNWFYTKGGYAVYPGLVNKLTFVSTKQTGL